MNVLGQLRAGQLAGSQRLDLSCGLTEFPREIFELADTLEVLNLSGNALSALPDDLHRLHRLRVLFCSDNQFTELPEVVGQCRQLDMVGFKANRIRNVPAASLPPSLRWLILTDNRIESLPSTLGHCRRLQKLMLAGNRLRALPETLADCRALELLRISANELEALPAWLLSLPRLAWLAFAGNPFDASPEEVALSRPAAVIDWQRLSLKQKLGEGASGFIHQADWQLDDGGVKPVAVKLFKGAVTSDGWPHSEMAACIAAGAHPGLIAVLGRVANHPEGTPGLVLELVDASFRNLAGPPSLQSCTRDVYGADAHWSIDTAWRMACGIASATAQLHGRGILHGDVYGHNILWNGRGDCLLGDFGAASFLPTDDEARSQALQRIEVRAFGCLLEELLAQCDPIDDTDEATRALMARLQQDCINPDVSSRPAFAEIASLLSAAAVPAGR
ncbi:leucine-rich repeat-containing protein kinase family protein [Variovorax sp. GT1P44]|uniref:leucine-rich repeat-containing protein kinase family protein n=1 Tax=Variovorax sp. GT1P44 TaxID=3443742 RepID=UPI003F4676EE